jgi:hypothetical protein
MNPAVTVFVLIHGSNCILSLSKIKKWKWEKCMEVTHEFGAPKVCEKLIS